MSQDLGEANDENFTCFVDDGQVYINAVIQASAVKDFKRRYIGTDMFQADI